MDLGGWRPEESRGDAGCCQTHAAVCVGKGSGDSGAGQSLKSLLQRLPACLPGLQRGDKGGKTTSRTTGGFKAPKKKKSPWRCWGLAPSPFPLDARVGGAFLGVLSKKAAERPFWPWGARTCSLRIPQGCAGSKKKKKSTGRGEGGVRILPPSRWEPRRRGRGRPRQPFMRSGQQPGCGFAAACK